MPKVWYELEVALPCCPSGEHLVPYDGVKYATREEAEAKGERAMEVGDYAGYLVVERS